MNEKLELARWGNSISSSPLPSICSEPHNWIKFTAHLPIRAVVTSPVLFLYNSNFLSVLFCGVSTNPLDFSDVRLLYVFCKVNTKVLCQVSVLAQRHLSSSSSLSLWERIHRWMTTGQQPTLRVLEWSISRCYYTRETIHTQNESSCY